MTTALIRRQVTADIDGTTYNVRGGRTTLDSGAVPYATTELELPLLDDSSLEWLDPDDGVRIPVEATVNGVTRSFDLGLRGRRVNHRAKTVTLRLSSDEALLTDYLALVDDAGARAHEASARAVTNYVLGKIGAALEAGTDDANVTAYWSVTNLHPNPRPGSATGYNIAANGTALTFTTLSGSNVIRWTSSSGTSNLNAGTTSAYRASAGKTYQAQWDWASAASGRSAALVMEFRSAGGTVLMARTTATATPYAATFQTLSVHATAPAGTETVYVYITTTGNSVATMHYVKNFILAESGHPVPFFDGATSGSGYTYAWTETANASPSTRTPTVERLPELFDWEPGTNAWDFLQAILSSAGLVLWCDELRDWHLAFPANRVIDTQVNVNDATARDGFDELSRDDNEASVSGVVVRYKWRDADGIERTAYDPAGTPEKAIRIDLDQAYPGPGAAAAILARRQGTGRVQEVTAITRIGTTPGMTAQISLPGAPDTLGRVTAVVFDHRSGFMDLGTAGLIDIGPGDWLELDADLDWDDVSAALDWEDA